MERLKLLRACALAALVCAGCAPRMYTSTEVMMGTFVEVTSSDSRAGAIVFSEMHRLEKLFSKYDPASEVSRLNAQGSIKASPETIAIINLAKKYWEQSNGAFDITVAGLVDMWGFKDKHYRVPAPDEIAQKLKAVGANKIIVNEKDFVVQFTVPKMSIDLGGIAKGFALDSAGQKLLAAGVTNCLINAGGQVYALGSQRSRPWAIALRTARQGGPHKVITLASGYSISTSADYEQYFERSGRRYSHIIDPRTGSPAQSGVIAVTIKSTVAAEADALTTAMFVLGKEKGKALVAQFPNAEIISLTEAHR